MGKSYEKEKFWVHGSWVHLLLERFKHVTGGVGVGGGGEGWQVGLGGAAWCSYLGRMFVGEMRFYRYFETIFERCLGPKSGQKKRCLRTNFHALLGQNFIVT